MTLGKFLHVCEHCFPSRIVPLHWNMLVPLPDGFVVRTPAFHYHGLGSVPSRGTEILGVAHGDQKRKGTAWVGSRLSATLPSRYLSAVYKLGSLRWQLVLMLP